MVEQIRRDSKLRSISLNCVACSKIFLEHCLRLIFEFILNIPLTFTTSFASVGVC